MDSVVAEFQSISSARSPCSRLALLRHYSCLSRLRTANVHGYTRINTFVAALQFVPWRNFRGRYDTWTSSRRFLPISSMSRRNTDSDCIRRRVLLREVFSENI
ncbi:hypothetical protein EVAR_77226_1 [Eumeta japonica]|uniref:Uncharacterized protein n=1 Tax=Eumeta variegata TaxID=151549 RepID=A0A4C1T528_EUMVA|nr:hypothetical protein EVAR_77226_1 [Eumeta japonica]